MYTCLKKTHNHVHYALPRQRIVHIVVFFWKMYTWLWVFIWQRIVHIVVATLLKPTTTKTQGSA